MPNSRLDRVDLQLHTRPRGGKQYDNGESPAGEMLLVAQMLIRCYQDVVALLFRQIK
jgi:hypothetical protein